MVAATGQRNVGERAVLGLAAFATLIALLTLAGYATGQVWLVRPARGLQTMSVTSALLVLLLATGVASLTLERVAAARASGAAAVSVSLVLLCLYPMTRHDVVSAALLHLFGARSMSGETSVATAVSTAMLGVCCFSRSRQQPYVAIAAAVMIASGLAILAYAYGVEDLYALSAFRTFSFQTALSLQALGTAVLFANQPSGVAGLVFAQSVIGRTTRRQLSFLMLPPLLGLLLLRTTWLGHLGPGAATALLIVLTVAPLACLILRDAQALSRLETERLAKQEADAAKLAIERRYRSLFERLETGFCIIEVAVEPTGEARDYRFLEVNPAFASQTGLKDAQGRWIKDLVPAQEQHWLDAYAKVAATGEPVRFEQTAKSLGRYFDVYAFRVDAPELRHVAVLFSDISQRRRAELELRALNETLEQRVAQRAAELEQVEEALRQSQKLEAIGQLTGGVAHDFNNLLTVIRGSVDLLRRPGLSDERRARYVEAIGETSDRAAKLTGQLLAFARRQALRPEQFDVAESLEQVMSIVSALIGSHIELTVEMAEEPCLVLADRSQFDTAIVNMAVNARDAMEGHGRISITSRPVAGVPATRSHPPMAGDFVAVSITDTGPGVLAADLGRIFEPFFTTKAVGAGTGLGLSQVFGFAKQSGGDVHVDSVAGEGAVFTLYLPRAAAGAATGEAVGPTQAGAGQGVCVLVVEDDAHVGDFAVQALKELGYGCVLAPDAATALAFLAEGASRFDVVFSDVVMPGVSGLELGQEIRARYPKLPVILTSGYSHVLAQNSGHGFELLHKPYSIEQLSRVLSKAVPRTAGPSS